MGHKSPSRSDYSSEKFSNSVKGKFVSATKFEKVLYWAATGLILFLMLAAIINYHISHENMEEIFTKYGYPTYIIYPLAYLKLIAVIIIVSNRYNNLKEMVYGAYFINMVAATAAHLSVGDIPYHAFVGLTMIPLSYYYSNKVRGHPENDLLIWKQSVA